MEPVTLAHWLVMILRWAIGTLLVYAVVRLCVRRPPVSPEPESPDPLPAPEEVRFQVQALTGDLGHPIGKVQIASSEHDLMPPISIYHGTATIDWGAFAALDP